MRTKRSKNSTVTCGDYLEEKINIRKFRYFREISDDIDIGYSTTVIAKLYRTS